MTVVGRLIMLFPGVIALGAAACLVWLAAAPGPWPIAALLGIVYLLPVAAFRVHQALRPMKIGGALLMGGSYVPWWGAHQIQLIYIAFPQLEALLRVVPGLYSAWLRLWGARIGKAVVWTPGLDITDRSLLEIGDRVVLGHRTALYAHMIRPSKTNLLLYVKPIRIEAGAFVGGYSVFGPGSRVLEGVYVPAWGRGYTNQVLS